MRTLLAVLVLLAAGLPWASAGTPNSCSGTTVKKLKLSADRLKLTVAGTISADPGLPGTSAGLTTDVKLTLAYEPEADPANTIFTATLPMASFVPVKGGVLYKDKTAAVEGILKFLVKDRRLGARKLVLKRKGTTPIAATADGNLRLVLEANGGCARTCPSVCTAAGGTTTCAKSTDTALCGLKSGCDPLNVEASNPNGRGCMLPYPSDFFTMADAGTATGRRVAFPQEVLPANNVGAHINPTAWNTLDGWSAGPIVMLHWPQGVDLGASGVPDQFHFGDSLLAASPIQLIEADAAGCQRVEVFGENDASAGTDGVTPLAPPNQLFMLRPGRRLKSATRYLVALQDLVGQDAAPIAAGTAFAALRDGTPSGSAAVEARRAHFDGILTKLAGDCGLTRGNLLLAWDFTTASDDAVTTWLLHMRDEAFAALGSSSAAPAFVIGSVTDNPYPGDVPERICRRVDGTFTAPLYTTSDGPGSLLNIDPLTNLPAQNGTTAVPFRVHIPCSVLGPGHSQGRPIFYGHGLLGSRTEVGADNLRQLMYQYEFVMGAVDWQGFSDADLATVFGFLNDLTGFRKLPERLHQGILNQLLFARLLHSPNGLPSDPNFIDNGTSVIDTSQIYWYGISQGGIEGGVVMAISQEATRGVLGVPAANYSTLLHRSVDFAPYFAALRIYYPDDLARGLTLPLIQQLWDRAEPNGYYHRTLPGWPEKNTPPHKLLVHMATSDAEVCNLGTTIMVRSMGMPQVSPVVSSYFGIAEQAAPFDGSAMVESDGGYGPVPDTNTPPAGNGAHGAMRALSAIQAQIDEFLQPDGEVQNFCSGPCDPS